MSPPETNVYQVLYTKLEAVVVEWKKILQRSTKWRNTRIRLERSWFV
jgi:hypothetical protein